MVCRSIFIFSTLVLQALAEGPIFCSTCANGGPPPMSDTRVTVTCTTPGATIARVAFASYGTPTGSCPTFSTGTCNADNSTAVVISACQGKSSCIIFPNTTTFGDPCYGTAKVLDVALTCSSGTGTATCGTPPPPPSLENFTASVEVDWAVHTATLRVAPSIQVVSHHALWRDAPQHNLSFATLAQLGANNVRFVPWLPYAQYGVAQLMPPSTSLCGPQNWATGSQKEPITLDCGPQGGNISRVDFASFGRATGNCGAYAAAPTCNAANSSDIVTSLCVGQQSCVLPTAAGGIFGTPCSGTTYLAVQVQCSIPTLHTYWNFTLPDQFITDTWAAVSGNISLMVPNFSTQPTWLYSPSDYNWNADASQPWGYSRGDAKNCNNTALGEYYGRLYSYFKNNMMVDEAGVTHVRQSGPALDIRIIEVFNEVDYEHGYTVEEYTNAFDAVVRGVRRHADPGRTIQYVGLSLPNIDNAAKVAQWAAYFLNSSNHAADVTDSLDYIGYHAYPTNGGYTPDPTTFARMFDYADSFITGVKQVDAIIESLSPRTRTMLDETGTDMDGVLQAGSPPDNNPRYWVAAAGYWAYIFARAANESTSVVQVGASQLMDAPGQEPSVTLLDWETGEGTARFWVVRMFVEAFPVGVSPAICMTTAVSVGGSGIGSDAVFAMAFEAAGARPRQLLLINKRNAFANVSLSCSATACRCTSYSVIDEANGVQPARSISCDGTDVITLAPYATAIALLT